MTKALLKAKLVTAIEWVCAILLLLAFAGLIFAVTTAHSEEYIPLSKPRAVQLWTLWVSVDNVPTTPLLRFVSLDACIAASYRHGFTTGETATCLPYRLGDFR